jgi:hypothetical protein
LVDVVNAFITDDDNEYSWTINRYTQTRAMPTAIIGEMATSNNTELATALITIEAEEAKFLRILSAYLVAMATRRPPSALMKTTVQVVLDYKYYNGIGC